MAMYVIADLHLHPKGEILLRAFESFVAKLHHGDQLYILGDLFNFFVGVDPHNQAQQRVRTALGHAQTLGITSYFIRGNRDFLMTAKEAQWLNMTLLTDIALVRFAEGHAVLLTHGDLFCTNDLAYMSYYRKVHNPCLQALFRALPMFLRRKIANNLREQSKHQDRSSKGREFYGVVDQTIDNYALEYSQHSQPAPLELPLPLLVHGHIHEFGQHGPTTNVQQRYVVGAWGKNFSYFKLSLPDSAAPLVSFRELPLETLEQADFEL